MPADVLGVRVMMSAVLTYTDGSSRPSKVSCRISMKLGVTFKSS